MRAVTLAYILAIGLSLGAYALMGGLDLRLRIGLSLGFFVGVVVVATSMVVRVGDEARPGSTEVPPTAPERDFSASKPGSQ
jgi:hypothetical protein